MQFKTFMETQNDLDRLVGELQKRFQGVRISAWENHHKVELDLIQVPPEMQNRGIGSEILKELKKHAQLVQKPIVVRPSADAGKKSALARFYDRNGFVKNTGKNLDFSLSSPFAATRYWKASP